MTEARRIAERTLSAAPAYDYTAQKWLDGGTAAARAAHKEHAASTLRALDEILGYAENAGMEQPELQAQICRWIAEEGK